jgi:hypothetical protein
VGAVLLAGVSPTLAGAGPRAAGPAAPDLEVGFAQDRGSVRVVVSGPAAAVGEVVGSDGAVRWVPGPGGLGSAAQFPAPGRPAGAVVVRVAGGVDALSPGLRPFTISAEVRRDVGGEADGDNVLQRGLWNDPGQYKLQLDGGHASCVVAGTRGRVIAEVEEEVVPGVWYRMTCRREDNTVRLTLRRLDLDGTWHATATGPIGSVRAASPASPLTIGGKVGETGEPTAYPDQLNGAVAAVVVHIG